MQRRVKVWALLRKTPQGNATGKRHRFRFAPATEKDVPRIAVDGYIIEAQAVQGEGGWMPYATIHDDRPDVDSDDVTDDYRVIAPEDRCFDTEQEAIDRAEVLGRMWVSQRG